MARPRSVAFQSLEVHRTARPDPRAGAAPARPTFAELLRLRRGPATAVDPPCEETFTLPPVAAPQPGSGDASSGGGGGDQPPADPQVASRRDDSMDWVDALAPTAAMIDALLQVPAVSDARRVGGADVHPVVASIAQTVAGFCNEPAVDQSEGWSVRMPLREDVLPSTTLALTLSSCWLQLRFETTSDAARDLLLIHRDALSDRLATTLSRQRDIAISID